MTEEQIIDYAIIERTFDKAGDAKAQWLMIKAISEPASPKNWRPVCFYNWSDKLGLCEMSTLKEFVKDHSLNCEICPYRIIIEGDHHKNGTGKESVTQKTQNLDINLDINQAQNCKED